MFVIRGRESKLRESEEELLKKPNFSYSNSDDSDAIPPSPNETKRYDRHHEIAKAFTELKDT
jgi:hypothetical protein